MIGSPRDTCAALAHIDGTLEHKGKSGRDFAGLHDEGAIREMADLAETAQPRDILLLQKRKHLVAARFQKRRFLSHARQALQKPERTVIPELGRAYLPMTGVV